MRILQADLQIAVALLIWLLSLTATRATRRLHYTLQPRQDKAMVVNGQTVYAFRRPGRPRSSFRAASAHLHVSVVQGNSSQNEAAIIAVGTHSNSSKQNENPQKSASVCVFEVTSHYSVTGKPTTELVLLKRAEIKMEKGSQHLQIDLTSRVDRWLRKRKPLLLLIDCVGCGGTLKIENATNVPRIELNMQEDPRDSLRRKRHRHLAMPRGDPACVNGKGCCKRQLYIDFRDLGWDSWIVAPVGYNAYYCNGSCDTIPRTPDTFSSHYAYVMDRYRRYTKPNIGAPCCVPTRLRAMSLIYMDRKGHLVKADVPDMIVDECGCA